VQALFREPSRETLGGAGFGRAAKRLLLATRPIFFPASVLPVIVGTVWGIRASGTFDGVAFMLALAATVLVHAGANVLNDVCDDLSGTDRANPDRIHPYTGGSRMIQNRVMAPRDLLWWNLALFIAAAILGAVLAAIKGPLVLLFGGVGLSLAILYSAPPMRLSAHGLGESVVAVAFGVLPVIGAAWLQGGAMSADLVLVSLPVGMWVGAILIINEVPDIPADAAAERHTLAVRLGARGAQRLYLGVHAAALAAAVALAARDVMPWAFLAGLSVLLFVAGGAALAIPNADQARLKRGIETTFVIHGLGCLWLAGWIFFAKG
jgi:1,4-dihydroxy-2-naphthoate octaprenyltransferase